MGFTHFPNGITSFGIPQYGGGLGPIGIGCGDIYYVVTSKASSNLYYQRLKENGIPGSDIFTTLALAYAATTGDQNDVIAVTPGAYTVTAELEWANDQTHLIGLGGPNQRYCPTTATGGAVKFYCATTGIDSILSISGDYNQFYGFQTQNTYSATTNRADIIIGGKNTYMNSVHARGGNGANQLNHADGGVPLIFESAGGDGFFAERCQFGTAGNNARTLGAGAVLFESVSSAYAPLFKECRFEMNSDTDASSNPKLIHLAADYAINALLLFERCSFYVRSDTGIKMDYAIVDACTTQHQIGLMDCISIGIDYWCNVADYTFTNTADAVGYGGKGIVITTG